MPARNRTARLVLIIAFLATLSTLPVSADPTVVRFRSLADGAGEARNTGKPMLLFFTAAWCGPCQELRIQVFSVGAIAKLIEERFVPVEIVDRQHEDGANHPDVQALLDRFAVRGFPTVVVTHVDGAAAQKQTGFVSRARSLSFLRDASARLEAAEQKVRRAEKH